MDDRSPVASGITGVTQHERDADAASHGSHGSGILSSSNAFSMGPPARQLTSADFGAFAHNVHHVQAEIQHEVEVLVRDGLLDFLGALVMRYMNEQTVVEGPVGAVLVLADLSPKLKHLVLQHPASAAVKSTFVKYHMEEQLRQYFAQEADAGSAGQDDVTKETGGPRDGELLEAQPVAKRGTWAARGPFWMLMRRHSNMRKI